MTGYLFHHYPLDYLDDLLVEWETLKTELGLEPDEVAQNYAEYMEELRARKRI